MLRPQRVLVIQVQFSWEYHKSLQDSLKSGKLKTPGATSEVMEQIVLLQKALEATGASPEEIAAVIAKATGPGLSDEAISEIMSKVEYFQELSSDLYQLSSYDAILSLFQGTVYDLALNTWRPLIRQLLTWLQALLLYLDY